MSTAWKVDRQSFEEIYEGSIEPGKEHKQNWRNFITAYPRNPILSDSPWKAYFLLTSKLLFLRS